MPTNEVVDTKPEGDRYVESPDFVPDPTHQFGTYDTSGTAGAAHARIEEVTPIFDIADAENAKRAARALDPDDDEVPSSEVVIHQGQRMHVADEEAVKDRVRKRAETVKPVRVFGKTQSQEEAAQSGDEGRETAQAQQEDQGASTGPTGDAEGTARQGAEDKDKEKSTAQHGRGRS